MKKFLSMLAIAVGLAAFSSVPARANDDAAYFLGGMLGGIVLDNILRPGPAYAAPVYAAPMYAPPPVVVYEMPAYEQVCTRKWVKVFDTGRNRYIKVQRKKCEWVPLY